MTCPDCGFDNLAGADLCEQCQQDLRSLDVLPRPRRGRGPSRAVLRTPLRELDPPLALTATPQSPVSEVIGRMQQKRQGSVLVVEAGKVVGIFTERDALNRLTGKKLDLDRVPVGGVMTRDPRVLRDDDTLATALHCMAVGSCRHVPVVREGEPPRFVSVRGVLGYLHRHGR
ncbi:MAG: CBS domain-containing protein [Candidatus Polarisedimenticolia bacterium]